MRIADSDIRLGYGREPGEVGQELGDFWFESRIAAALLMPAFEPIPVVALVS